MTIALYYTGQEPLRPLHEAPPARQGRTAEERGILSQSALRSDPADTTHRYV